MKVTVNVDEGGKRPENGLLYDVQPAFFSEKLTLIFGQYTGIQVYENGTNYVRNNSMVRF